MGLISGSGRSPEAESDNTVHYSCLENSMDRGAWQPMRSQSWTWLSNWPQSRYPDLVCHDVVKYKVLRVLVSRQSSQGLLVLLMRPIKSWNMDWGVEKFPLKKWRLQPSLKDECQIVTVLFSYDCERVRDLSASHGRVKWMPCYQHAVDVWQLVGWHRKNLLGPSAECKQQRESGALLFCIILWRPAWTSFTSIYHAYLRNS